MLGLHDCLLIFRPVCYICFCFSLRDLLHTQYKSSHVAKKKRRREDQTKLDEEVDEFVQTNCRDIMNKLRLISLSAKQKTDGKLFLCID